MLMPKLQPFAIKTQKHNLLLKVWKLIARKRQWQVIEEWRYKLPNNRVIIIPKGFVFDGSSYPWIVWLFFSPTGLLLIPVIIHDFCFKYNYLWVVQDHKISKFKENHGFRYWCQLIRRVGIERNELMIIDYLIWGLTLLFGWVNWFLIRRTKYDESFPKDYKIID